MQPKGDWIFIFGNFKMQDEVVHLCTENIH